MSRRPSIGGIDRGRPGRDHDRLASPRAAAPRRRRGARRRPAVRRPAGPVRARARAPASSSHCTWPSSSQCAAMSSRQSSTASHVELAGDRGRRARHPPHLGQRLARAAAAPCSACTPSRSTHRPRAPTSTMAMLAPQSTQRPAMFSPAEPPPITMTSNCSTGCARSVIRSVSPLRGRLHAVGTPEWRHDHSARHRHRRHRHQGCPRRHPQRASSLADRHRILTPHPATPEAVSRCRRRAGRVLRLDGAGRRDVPGDDQARRGLHARRTSTRRGSAPTPAKLFASAIGGDGHGGQRRRRRRRRRDGVRRGQGRAPAS